MTQGLAMTAINRLLQTKDILADESVLESVWQDFSDGCNANLTKEGTEASFLLDDIEENIIKMLRFTNEFCLELIDQLIQVADEIIKEALPVSYISGFLISLVYALYPYTDKEAPDDYLGYFSNSPQTSMSNQHSVISPIDAANLLSILVTHKLVRDGELEDYLDEQAKTLATMNKSFVGFIHPGNSQTSMKFDDVHNQPLSMLAFGVSVDKLIYCVQQFLLFDRDVLPDVPSEIKRMLYNDETIRHTNTLHRGRYVLDRTNQRILMAIGQYIDVFAEMEPNDAMVLYCKTIKDLSTSSIKLEQVTAISCAFLVIIALLLKLTKKYSKESYRTLQSNPVSVSEINRHIDQIRKPMSVTNSMELYMDLQSISKCVELKRFVSGHENSGDILGTRTYRPEITRLMEPIYSIFSSTNEFDQRHITTESTGGVMYVNASTSEELSKERNAFVTIAEALHNRLMESLLSGQNNYVPVILGAMGKLKSDYSRVVTSTSTSEPRVSNILETMEIDRSTYQNVCCESVSQISERSDALLNELKKTI